MPIVQPPRERHVLQDHGSSLSIIIPGRRNYLAMIFLGFWLIGWAVGETVVAGMLFAGIIGLLSGSAEVSKLGSAGLSGAGLFMLVWLSFWTAGGAFALYTFLWQLAGKENIEVSYESIKIQPAIFGLGRTKEYSAIYVKDLRVTPLATSSDLFGWQRASSFWGLTGGHLAFDYGSKTFRFGGGVEEAEAKQILEKIIARFPQFRGRKPDAA